MTAIGIDVGGTGIKIGAVEEDRILDRACIPTRRDGDYNKILCDIVGVADGFAKRYRAEFVGISCCGLINSASGTVGYSNNVGWRDAPLVRDLSEQLRLPAAIANDAKCAALGEALYGAGKGCSRVLMLTLGTGVGGGFVRNRRLETGDLYADAADIFGHITLEKDGRPCTCGRRGCFEAYCSATALKKRAAELYGAEWDAKEIFARAESGDARGKALVTEFSAFLAAGTISLANVVRPQVIVFGGGVSSSFSLFAEKVQTAVEREVYGYAYAPVTVCAAKLSDAGIIGAAALQR